VPPSPVSPSAQRGLGSQQPGRTSQGPEVTESSGKTSKTMQTLKSEPTHRPHHTKSIQSEPNCASSHINNKHPAQHVGGSGNFGNLEAHAACPRTQLRRTIALAVVEEAAEHHASGAPAQLAVESDARGGNMGKCKQP
jgi:hypothetical protein